MRPKIDRHWKAPAYALRSGRSPSTPLDGFWVHVDADVVDPSHFPAVDAPAPGGIALDELTTLLRRLAAERGMVGLDVTILDPDLDESGEQAAALADVLADGLGR